MVKYKKNYLDHFKLTTADFIACEFCNAPAVDIHHATFKSQGGKDDITNLIALCRNCHNKAHNSRQFNENLKLIIKKRHE